MSDSTDVERLAGRYTWGQEDSSGEWSHKYTTEAPMIRAVLKGEQP
jgi:hypothetical protein